MLVPLDRTRTHTLACPYLPVVRSCSIFRDSSHTSLRFFLISLLFANLVHFVITHDDPIDIGMHAEAMYPMIDEGVVHDAEPLSRMRLLGCATMWAYPKRSKSTLLGSLLARLRVG